MIKIALTNLRRYNEGDLIFKWVTLPCEDFEEVFNVIGHDEYFISDYECEEFHIEIHEYENLERLNELAEELECLDKFEKIILQAIMEANGSDIYDALDTLKDEAYIFYKADDFEEFIDMSIENGMFGEISEKVKNFLDYEKLTEYFQNGGYQMTSVGVITTF